MASSELSWQSLSPSQMKAGLVQIPVEHWNCPGLHLNSAVGRGGWGETSLGNIFRANLNLPLFPLWVPLQELSNQHAERCALTAAKRAAAGCCLPSGYTLGRESELLCSRLHEQGNFPLRQCCPSARTAAGFSRTSCGSRARLLWLARRCCGAVGALKGPGGTARELGRGGLPAVPSALTAVLRLIRTVPAVVLGVAFPPERDAFVILADKLRKRDKFVKAAQMVTPDGNGGPRWHCPQGTPSAKGPDLCAIPSQTLLYLGAPTCPKPSTPSPPSTASGVWGGQRMGSVLPELPPSPRTPQELQSVCAGKCHRREVLPTPGEDMCNATTRCMEPAPALAQIHSSRHCWSRIEPRKNNVCASPGTRLPWRHLHRQAGCYLAGCAVGDAGLAIAAQVEVGGTSTFVPPARREEAEVAAACIVGLAGVVGNWGDSRERTAGQTKGEDPNGAQPPSSEPLLTMHIPFLHPVS